MTNKDLKKLEDSLWDSANRLRATGGIKSADYAVPVLGIIFLRFVDNKYSAFEAEILKEYKRDAGTRNETPLEKIALRKCGIYLSEKSRYDYLLNLPTSVSLASAIKEAMEDIEKYQDEHFKDILPKDAYAEIEKNSADILPELMKSFSDIPSNATGDVFGKIYEYFLGKFALSEGQKGGEFFTPTSVVRFIVEVIEPYSGKIFDPACGSGGMFVQSANFIEQSKCDKSDIYVCGQENEGSTVKLAKMNLLVNNLSGEIKKANSYEDNHFDSEDAFDFVMANPPFNVKGVKESAVKNDTRFTTYGLPKNKGKKDDKITDANYLWISLFATSLNATGKAGFVMPNSASDARNSEYEIRKKLVDSGIVDTMVTIPSNMFYTVTLPATLWFFDKAKTTRKNKDKILFIDAREVYHQIDRAHREWTNENILNLSIITKLYHGETESFKELVSKYKKSLSESLNAVKEVFKSYKILHNSKETEIKLHETLKLNTVDVNTAFKSVKVKHNVYLEELQPNKRKVKERAFVRELSESYEALELQVKEINYWSQNIEWLESRFPDGVYSDVVGLCKVADKAEYALEQDYSLNAGRYVGINIDIDENFDYKARVKEIHSELATLNAESQELMSEILGLKL